MARKIPTMDQVTPHFKRSELACKCCGLFNMPERMLDFIERVRNEFGSSMTINSGVRCPMHNAKVGGEKNSPHMQGLAIDIKCIAGPMRHKLLRAAYANGALGVGIYPSWIHLDIMERVSGNTTWVKPG